MVREEIGVVVVNALAESPWGVFSIGLTIPIALFMGWYLRFLRPGKVLEVTGIGVLLLLAAILGGQYVEARGLESALTLDKETLTLCLVIYGFVASILPVWMLLTPRDYLSTFMKIGVIVLLAVGLVIAAPTLQAPAVSDTALDGTGPVFAGKLFPFVFITIACGALSGFHALISSGTTPKMIRKESHVVPIGYGGMLMESFVAISACRLGRGVRAHARLHDHPGPAHRRGRRGRRELPDLPDRWRAHPGGRHIPHPRRRRRRHPGRPVHTAGHDRQRVAAVRRRDLAPRGCWSSTGRAAGPGCPASAWSGTSSSR